VQIALVGYISITPKEDISVYVLWTVKVDLAGKSATRYNTKTYICSEIMEYSMNKRMTISLPVNLQKRLQEYVVNHKANLRKQSEAICELVDIALKEKGY
jgi:6-pyruvoyl-tetrahydropterin synthase